jgi:hypothetical protein
MATPIIAPPPADPINIDFNGTYQYVIASSGEDSLSVDPHSSFSLSLTDRTLSVTFAGETLNLTEKIFSVVVHATNGEGTTDSTIRFNVHYNSDGKRRYPSLISPATITLAKNAALNLGDYVVTSDLPNHTALFAGGLPAGFTAKLENDALLIYGAAPDQDITIAATLFGDRTLDGVVYRSVRYVLIVVGAGSSLPILIGDDSTTGTGGDSGTLSGSGILVVPPSSTRIFYDGNYNLAEIAGPPVYEVPFKADPRRYAYRLPFWQFSDTYSDISLGSPGLLGGYYAGLVGTPKEIGGGILEFWREYALIPNTRTEFEEYSHSYQLFHTSQDDDGTVYDIVEVTTTVNSRCVISYSRGVAVAPIPLRYVTLGRHVFSNNGTPGIAEACSKLWKGDIYETFIRYVPPLTISLKA